MKIKSTRPTIEPLESRIAPARIINVGLPNNPNDTDFNEAPFVNLETAGPSDLIAAAVGKGSEGLSDTFYIRLSAGDSMNLFRIGGSSSAEPFLLVKKGQIVAFFTDKNLDNEVQEDEISGISMGKNASFELRAALSGDVVANLDDKGTKDQADDSLFMGGLGQVPANFGISNIRIGSSVGGFADEGILYQTAQEVTVGEEFINEVQEFAITAALSSVGQSFRIGYGAYTTPSLALGSSAQDIQDALNFLQSVRDDGEVVVEKTADNPLTFSVEFKETGDKANLFKVYADSFLSFTADQTTNGGAMTSEVQNLDIGLISGRQGRLTLNFDGEAAAPLGFDATPQQVEDVLNATNSISLAGGVTVSGVNGGPYQITFNNAGDNVPVTARAEDFFSLSVGGKILASGNITGVVVAGGVQSILAGGAANNAQFDFFPKYIGGANGRIVDVPGGEGTFLFQPASGKAGPLISNIIVDRLGGLAVGVEPVGRIEAGAGGDGGKGGSIKNVEIRRDPNGFSLIAGDGGNSSLLKPRGGAGGTINSIYIDGATDIDGNSPISIIAGLGGDSTNSAGGVGGSIANLFIGYRLLDKSPVFTDSPLRDDVLVRAGAGGSGKIGASGGALNNLRITVAAPNVEGDEMQIFAGDGGDGQAVRGGRGGKGGSITNSLIQNIDISPGHSMDIFAGNGGAAGENAKGAAGGSLLNLILTGRQFDFEAGDGSDGKTGGLGGSVNSLSFRTVNGIFADTVILNAGRGGDGLAGNAGNGGKVGSVSIVDADFYNFIVNDEQLGKGDGGDSVGGVGGAGGSIVGLKVTDFDYGIATDTENLYSVRAGDGGSGTRRGGNGGLLSGVNFSGFGIEMEVSAGDGGDASTSGAGGRGGNISKGEFSASGTVLKTIAGEPLATPVDSFVRAGFGGDGAGVRGAGGAGGNILKINLKTEGSADVSAGDGGNGSGSAPGIGGYIHNVGLFALRGDGLMSAGDGGAVGTRAAKGGSITGVSNDQLAGLFASRNLTAKAGDGSNGGAGGSINYFGYGSTQSDLVPTPTGDIYILAGQGSSSSDDRLAGAGGSIFNVNGSVSYDAGTTTLIQAGAGGSTSKKGAPGGKVANLALQRGGNAGVEFSIVAGDAGDSPLGKVGAKGGDVSGVRIIDVSPLAIFRHITAGNGGDASKRGGTGGSIGNINVVGHDIGLRSGVAYGYDSMGGIFAGDGGSATVKGLAGNVTSITADAIGSIAAGRGAAPQLVNKVESIYLNDSKLLIESEGAFEPLGIPGATEEQRFAPVSDLPFVISFAATGNIFNRTILAAGSTSTEVEAALNNVASINNVGGVTVFQPAASNEYRVTFNVPGDRPPLHISSLLNVVEYVQGNVFPEIHEVLAVQIDPVLFKGLYITVDGNTAAFSDAAQLTAPVLENLLESLGAAVSVTAQANNTFQIVFDVPGDSALFKVEADKRPSGFADEFRDGTDPSKIVYIYNGERSVPLLKNETANNVAKEVNLLPSIRSAGEVSVTSLQPNGYRFEFKTTGDMPQITAEELIVYKAAEELAGEDSSQFQALELVKGDLERKVNEVQRVKIDSKLIGRLTVSFGSSATDFVASGQVGTSAVDANLLEDKLNLLANVAAVGGVTVADLGEDVFQITFNEPGDQSAFNFLGNDLRLGYALEVTKGTALSQEQQAFTRIEDFTNPDQTVTSYLFQIYFGTDSTNFLSSSATAVEVEDALNNLQSIIDVGGVDVSTDNDSNSFIVTFAENGDTEPLYVINKQSDSGALLGSSVRITGGFFDAQDPENLNGLNVVEEQVITLVPDVTGFFDLAFKGNKTVTLRAPSDQTDFSKQQTAIAIEEALNALPSVEAAGGVDVSTTSDAYAYAVTFRALGTQPLFTGNATQVKQVLDETVRGADRDNIQEVQSVSYNPNGTFNVTFPVGVVATENIAGSPLGNEVQVLNLAAVEAIPTAEFTLKFGADETAALPSNADAAQIEAALNGLQSVQDAGNVTVTLSGAGLFTVTFGNLEDQLQVIKGTVTGSQTTIDINGNDTPENVAQALENALNALSSVSADGGVNVLVSSLSNKLNVVFNSVGDKPLLVGSVNVYEVQSIPLLSLGEYEFSYNGDTTSRLPAGSTPADVQAAINALPGIPVGGVTVTDGFHNDFTFTFNTSGDFETLIARQYLPLDITTVREGTSNPGGVREQQEITQPRRLLLDQLNFGVANLVGGLLDATEFDAHIFKWVDTDNNGRFDLGEVPIDGLIVAKNYSQVLTNLIPEARYTGGEFTFVETTPGDGGTAEVQTLTIKADKFSLTFDGDETGTLSGKSKANTVAKALNALDSIKAIGGVKVSSSLANTFTITFNNPGERNEVLAPFFYDFNNIIQ